MPANGEDLLTPSEAAEMLGVSRQRIHELVELGRLTALRSARHVYIERSSIQERKDANDLNDEWMTTPQVAARFDVTSKTVRRWVADGRLSAVAPHGRALRFDPKEIKRFRPPALGGRHDRKEP